MTAKSRQRKLNKHKKPALETFNFKLGDKIVRVQAETREQARELFEFAYPSNEGEN